MRKYVFHCWLALPFFQRVPRTARDNVVSTTIARIFDVIIHSSTYGIINIMYFIINIIQVYYCYYSIFCYYICII